jgi:hypothetical protein
VSKRQKQDQKVKKQGGDDFPCCLMLIRFSDEYRGQIAKIVKATKAVSDEYMQRYHLGKVESTPDPICEGALTGEFDFYVLFKYREDGPVWLAARLHQLGIASEVMTMQAMPRERFERQFGF